MGSLIINPNRQRRSRSWIGLVMVSLIVVASGVVAYVNRPPELPPPGTDFVGHFDEMAEENYGKITLTFRVSDDADCEGMILRLKHSLDKTMTISLPKVDASGSR